MKTAVAVARSPHQRGWAEAFVAGIRRHGWNATVEPIYRPADLAILWGVRNTYAIQAQRKGGGEICVLERGYLGDRFAWTSVSFGGDLNGRARFHGPFADGSRWKKHFEHLMEAWKSNLDGYVLVLGQVPTDMSLKGVNGPAFWAKALDTFRRQGFQVKFRPHPLANRYETRKPGSSLAEDLAGAQFAVTWNSNSAVDAVLAGVPAIAMDEGSMAWDVTGHELAPPPAPEREAWAHALAWKQWQLEEISSGECWAHVGGHLG